MHLLFPTQESLELNKVFKEKEFYEVGCKVFEINKIIKYLSFEMEFEETKRSSLCDTISEFSVRNLKLNQNVKNLKNNLFPKSGVHSPSYRLDKLKSLMDDEKRLIPVKIYKDEKSIDKLLGKALSLRKNHLKLRKVAKNHKEKKRFCESTLIDLNVLKANYEYEDNSLKNRIKKADYIRCRSEDKTKSISVYCNDTKEKTENIGATVTF